MNRHWLAPLAVLGIFILPAATLLAAGEPVWVEVAELYGSDIDAGDHFGERIAIDGATLVAATFRKEFGGAVYVFERSPEAPTEWIETAKLTPPPGDRNFGNGVHVVGDTIAVTSTADDGLFATTFFARDAGGPGAWGQVGRQTTEEGAVSLLDPEMLAYGHATADVNGLRDAGAVHLFEPRPDGPGDWRYIATLTASDPVPQDHFGSPVARSGDTLLVGADDVRDLGFDSGAAYVFERDEAGDWIEVAKLYRSDGDEFDDFGSVVDIDGETAIISGEASGRDEGPFIFQRDEDGVWSEHLKLFPSDVEGPSGFGRSAVIAGNVAVVGDSSHHAGDEAEGAAYLYERHHGGPDAWGEVAILVASDPEDLHGFGDPLALDGNTLVVGAENDSDRGFRAGSVYIFSRVEPLVSVVDPCPGRLRVSVIGVTPGGEVVLLGGRSEGKTPIPSGPCAGTEVGLADPAVLWTGTATGAGDLELEREVGEEVCGGLLQAVDVASCTLSAVAAVR